MPIGGFGGPSGRRVHSVERALSASTLLPTVAFAALGAVIVLLVAQMGIPPLGAVGGPSARDGGRGVTMPRMSISIGPQRLQHSPPARDRETTTADARTGSTGPTGPTTLTFARPVAHTIPPTLDRETTTPDAQSAAMTAALTGAAGTNATVADVAVTNPTVIGRAVTMWEVTTAAVEPQVQAGADATDAPKVMYTLLARAALAPALEPDDRKPQMPQSEDTSITSVKAPQNTDATQASEHAKAAKSGP
ncbi:MAG TPA: hypothetical protein VIM47_02090 [Dermatophilaceae bacterium]